MRVWALAGKDKALIGKKEDQGGVRKGGNHPWHMNDLSLSPKTGDKEIPLSPLRGRLPVVPVSMEETRAERRANLLRDTSRILSSLRVKEKRTRGGQEAKSHLNIEWNSNIGLVSGGSIVLNSANNSTYDSMCNSMNDKANTEKTGERDKRLRRGEKTVKGFGMRVSARVTKEPKYGPELSINSGGNDNQLESLSQNKIHSVSGLGFDSRSVRR
jgi:hypothetical protein